MKKLIRDTLNKVPGVRTLFYQSPPYYIGSVLENRLGWQLVRLALSPRTTYPENLIVESHRQYFEEIKATGVTVIPNALSPGDRETVANEAADIEKQMEFRGLRSGHMEGYIEQAVYSIVPPAANATMWRILAKNPLINLLASYVMGLRIKEAKRLDLDFYRSIDLPQEESNDVDNVLHSDLHLDTVKVFYTLSEVTAENGPFVFAKGTHRRTPKRTRHEYRKSIDNALLIRGRAESINPERLVTVGPMQRVKLSDQELKDLEVEETHLTAPAGALIVANTFGFHRRGEFKPGQLRRWIQIGYRSYNRGLS